MGYWINNGFIISFVTKEKKMKTKDFLLIAVGLAAIAGVVFYVEPKYKKHKAQKDLERKETELANAMIKFLNTNTADYEKPLFESNNGILCVQPPCNFPVFNPINS